MKMTEAISRATLGFAFALLVGGWAVSQEAAGFIRLVEEEKGYYHRSVDKEMFINRNARNIRKNKIGKICSGASDAPLQGNQNEFDAWFTGYYYPLMTDPKELPNLAKLRRELSRYFFDRIKNEPAGLQVRDHLNKLTLDFMKKLATVNVHPGVRYNAMLIIGDLDSCAAETTGGGKPPEPMAEALEVLQAELTSSMQIDAVRVAALLGLRRHAELNRQRPADRQWTEAQVTSLAGKVGAIAAAKKPPAGRSVDGHTWMRRLALETLTELGAVRSLPAVTTLVDRIISDEAEPLDLRVAAAKSQGRLKSPLPMGAKAGEMAEKVARIGVDAVIAELTPMKSFVEHLQREELNGTSRPNFGGSERGRGGLGILEGDGSSSGSKPEEVKIIRDPRVSLVQRRLKMRLEGVRQGLVGEDGASGLAAAGDKAAIDKLVKAIVAIQQALDKAPGGDPVMLVDLEPFYVEISDKGAALEELLPKAAPPKTTTPTTPATDGPVVDEPAADGPVSEEPVAEPAGPAP